MNTIVEFEALFHNFKKNRNNPRSAYWEGNTRRAWYQIIKKNTDQKIEVLVAVACIEGYVLDWKYLPRNNRSPNQIKTNKLRTSAHFSALWIAEKWAKRGQRINVSEVEQLLIKLHGDYFPSTLEE